MIANSSYKPCLPPRRERENFPRGKKNVRDGAGRPVQTSVEIDEGFPLTRPQWDYNTAQGRERLSNYRRALVAGLRGAARKPTNLAKVREVMQGPTEPPSVFLERLMEAYRRYTPFDPTSESQQAAVAMDCKERGHWAQECSKKGRAPKALTLKDDE